MILLYRSAFTQLSYVKAIQNKETNFFLFIFFLSFRHFVSVSTKRMVNTFLLTSAFNRPCIRSIQIGDRRWSCVHYSYFVPTFLFKKARSHCMSIKLKKMNVMKWLKIVFETPTKTSDNNKISMCYYAITNAL